MPADIRVHETVVCPACGNPGHTVVPLGDPPLRRCQTCSLIYASRYGDPADIYATGYLCGDTDFGINVMDPLFQQYLAYAATRRMKLIERTVGGPGSILDVGCGTGEVLAVAKQRGWATAGAEPVAESAEHAIKERGLDVRPGLLEESGWPERSFDVVSAFHVVEHMADAPAFLRMIARWVRPGGHVVVEVPNWYSFHRRNAGPGWVYLCPLEHVGHYTPKTLRATLVRSGLKPVLVTTPGFLWHKQTLDQQLEDLGLYQWKRRLRFAGRGAEIDGRPAVVPRRAAAIGLKALQGVFRRAGVGQVVLAVARVPA